MPSKILVALRVPATPERAFAVFTESIGAWWQPNDLFSFTSDGPGRLSIEPWVGGRFTETQPGGAVFEIGRVLAWEPPSRLSLSWRQRGFRPDQSTRVDVYFEANGDETRVVVEHSGWDVLPPNHAAKHGFPEAVFLRRHAEWWQALLAALRDSCRGAS